MCVGVGVFPAQTYNHVCHHVVFQCQLDSIPAESEREESQGPVRLTETDRSDLHTGPVPVQRGDQPPGGALLLQQPANSRRLCALTCSEDDRLQQFHLETCVSESDDKVDPSR